MRDQAHGAPEPGDFGVGRRGGKVGQRNVAAAGNNQHVRVGARRDIGERNRVGVLLNKLGRYLPTQNAREDVAVVVGAGSGNGHGRVLVKTCRGVATLLGQYWS